MELVTVIKDEHDRVLGWLDLKNLRKSEIYVSKSFGRAEGLARVMTNRTGLLHHAEGNFPVPTPDDGKPKEEGFEFRTDGETVLDAADESGEK